MAHSYHDIAFTPTILDLQSEAGSRAGYASMSEGGRHADRLSPRETEFIARRDSFYMASVSETGWPYVQHRGGPRGFMKVLDEKTIGFADYSGNRQYVSTGNFMGDGRVSLFFMDYPNRRRLKMLGRVRIAGREERALIEKLEDPDYPAQVERAFIITVEAFDWNCPAHITPRFTEDEVRSAMDDLVAENRRLQATLESGTDQSRDNELGSGALALTITGVRQRRNDRAPLLHRLQPLPPGRLGNRCAARGSGRRWFTGGARGLQDRHDPESGPAGEPLPAAHG